MPSHPPYRLRRRSSHGEGSSRHPRARGALAAAGAPLALASLALCLSCQGDTAAVGDDEGWSRQVAARIGLSPPSAVQPLPAVPLAAPPDEVRPDPANPVAAPGAGLAQAPTTGEVSPQASPPAQAAPNLSEPLPDPFAPPSELEPPTAERQAAYDANRPKGILDLQPYRRAQVLPIADDQGRTGTATLTDLNPHIRTWYLLEVTWSGGSTTTYHLQNPDGGQVAVELRPQFPTGVVLHGPGEDLGCPLWAGTSPAPLVQARTEARSFAPLCEGRLSLLNPTEGHRSTLEWTTDFLRDNIWGGEKITAFVKEQFFQDQFLSTAELVAEADSTPRPRAQGAPQRPLIAPEYQARELNPEDLGLEIVRPSGGVQVGRWYPVVQREGMFASVVQASVIDPSVAQAQRGRVVSLEEVELKALVYLVAMDLDRYDLGFALGTDHPRVDWSDRALPAMRSERLPGPDGIGTISPLIRTGKVPPSKVEALVATFTGGFKRSHGAFKSSDLANRNSGSHYGFIEHGAILSKLQPGLATTLIYADGQVDLRTWGAQPDPELWRLRFARQNGVPIVETDPETGQLRPGAQVASWGGGNWSGSVQGNQRTVRGALCLQDSEVGRFLIYAYFSSATPSGMARVLQAYGCRYAMLLDMNALEHTYFASYRGRGDSFKVEHLIRGMDVLDKSEGSRPLPRFVAFADNRDFFYVTRARREAP